MDKALQKSILDRIVHEDASRFGGVGQDAVLPICRRNYPKVKLPRNTPNGNSEGMEHRAEQKRGT